MKRMAFLLVAALLTSACGELFEPAAATVGGDKITIDKVQAALADFEESAAFERIAQQGDSAAIKRQFEQNYLSQLIRRAILEPEAESRGISVTDSDVTERVDVIKQDFPTESAFEEALKEQGVTPGQLDDLVYDQLLEERVRDAIVGDIGPTEDELAAHYRDNEADFRQSRAQHILVSKRPLAESLAARLQAAPPKEVEDLFGSLAKKHSEDPGTADAGGDLGYFGEGELVPEFEQAVQQLEIGEVSDPVQSQFGFHIIRLTDRRTRPFEEVREEIRAQLAEGAQNEAWNEWLGDAYESAGVEVNPRYGEFDEEALRVVDVSAESVPGAEVPPEEPAGAEVGD